MTTLEGEIPPPYERNYFSRFEDPVQVKSELRQVGQCKLSTEAFPPPFPPLPPFILVCTK